MSLSNNQNLPPWAVSAVSSNGQPGDDIIVRLCIAIITSDGSAGDGPNIQMLTLGDERLPVPLANLTNFPDIRRTLRLLLHSTMSHYGVQSTQMTHSAVILPRSRYPPRNGLLGVTDNQYTLQNYTNTIRNLYHAPCNLLETCDQCREPAMLVACFPKSVWNEDPGTSINLRDRYSSEHGATLRIISVVEDQRYRRMIERQTITQLGTSATAQNPNPRNVASIPSRTGITSTANQRNTDPTKGPKGRSLVGTAGKKTDQKEKDYSMATLRPVEAEQGRKAETDVCLTCIQYNRKCRGTTMKLVKTQRSGRTSQWKCDQCCNPQRRCLWRPSLSKVTTYQEAFDADGGKSIQKNTVEGRRTRAEERTRSAKEAEDGSDEDEEGFENGDEE